MKFKVEKYHNVDFPSSIKQLENTCYRIKLYNKKVKSSTKKCQGI